MPSHHTVLPRGVISASFAYTKYTGVIEKMDAIWNRCNLESTGRIYIFGILKC